VQGSVRRRTGYHARVDLASLGWNDERAAELAALPGAFAAARVAAEHRGAVELIDERGAVFWGELLGRLRHDARDRRDLPAVGDWVAFAEGDGSGPAVIHAILPRRTCFVRLAAGERVEPQVIAANVDVVLVVTSANTDFNVRRLERYLTAVADSGARAVVVVNKIDLVDDATVYAQALPEVAVTCVSAARGEGLDAVRAHLGAGVTVALVGSSGVGKSTLVNQLLGREVQTVRAIRADDDRGRHTTTHRQLIAFDGGLLIDTPGMRELKPWIEHDPAATSDTPEGFADVDALAARCRFRDCTHHREPGCAVRDALPAERLEAWRKLTAELATSRARRRKW
jgi:ribosome biogenesis GTPase